MIIIENNKVTSKTTKIDIVGKRIRHLRKSRKLSQNKLAEAVDVSREHLAKLETAKRYPSLGLIFALAEALETESAAFFTE